jgi:hypothetical protein
MASDVRTIAPDVLAGRDRVIRAIRATSRR